ncbi:MAG: hypothetical protein ChlgKO_08170 [Chlamydiales bacterium]
MHSWANQELTQAKRSFSKSPSINRLQDIFHWAISFLPDFKKPLVAPEESGEFTACLTGIKEALNEPHFAIPDLPILPPSLDSDELRELSYLRRDDFCKFPISADLFSSFFGHVWGNFRAPFSDSLNFLHSFLEEELRENPLNDEIIREFKTAHSDEIAFSKFIHSHAKKSEEEKQAALLDYALSLQSKINLLSSDSPFLFFGKTSEANNSASLTNMLLNRIVPKECQQLFQDGGKDFIEEIEEKVLDFLQNCDPLQAGENSPLQSLQSSYRNMIASLEKSFPSIIPKRLSASLIQMVQDNLQRRIFGEVSPEGDQSIPERLWNELQQNGVEETLKHALKQALEESRSLFDENIHDIAGDLNFPLSRAMRQGLSLTGIPLQPEEKFWIEINKQENEKVTLRLYTGDVGSDLHPEIPTRSKTKMHHLPLVFSDIDPEKLDNDFFYQLLAFQAYPQWKMGITYRLEDLGEFLLLALEKEPDQANFNTLLPKSLNPSERPTDWLRVYLFHHMGLNEESFSHIFHFKLPLAILQNYWIEGKKDPKLFHSHSFRSGIKRLIKTLSKQGLLLYKKKKISESELQALYGTILDVQEAFTPKAESPRNLKPSHILPPRTQDILAGFLEKRGFSPADLEGIREMFTSLFGAEMGDSFDAVADDVLSDIALEEGFDPTVFSFSSFRKNFSTNCIPEFSKATLFRSLVKGMSVLWSYTHLKIQVSLLEKCLHSFFPQLKLTRSMQHIAMLIIHFGPSACKALLPKEAYKTLFVFYELFCEIATYIKRRVLLNVLRAGLQLFLGEKSTLEINRKAQITTENLTQKGKISLSLPEQPILSKRFSIPLSLTQKKAPKAPAVKSKNEAPQFKHRWELPRPPVPTAINKENLEEHLDLWIKEINILSSDQQLERNKLIRTEEALFYLHEVLHRLPIPSQKGGELWEAYYDQSVQEKLHLLLVDLIALSNDAKSQPGSAVADLVVENIASHYTLFAILLRLAKNCPHSGMDENFIPSMLPLEFWLKSPLLKITSKKAFSRIQEIAQCFKLDLSTEYQGPIFCSITNPIDSWFKTQLSNFTPSSLSNSGFNPFLLNRLTIQSSWAGFSGPSIEHRTERKMQLYLKHVDRVGISQADLLLADPPLTTSYKALKTRLLKEENAANEGLLSQEARNELDLFKYEMGLLTHDLDTRKGIIPRSIYLARFSFAAAVEATHFSPGNQPRSRSDKNQLLQEGLNHQIHPAISELPFEFMTNISKRFFKQYRLRNPNFDPSNQLWYTMPALSKRIFSFPIRDPSILKRLQTPSKRSQSRIMQEGPLSVQPMQVSRELCCLFEMINSDRLDQIVRALSFFVHARKKLASSYMQNTLDLLLHNVAALESQLSERPEIVADIGIFFEETIHYFLQKSCFQIALNIIEIGQDFLFQCERYVPEAQKYFPDFRAIIRNRIAPDLLRDPKVSKEEAAKSNFYAYCFLISSYKEIEPDSSNDLAMLDIARLFYRRTLAWKNVPYKRKLSCHKVLYKWEPLIQEKIAHDQVFRNHILDALTEDIGLFTSPGNWEGEFPKFHKGDLQYEIGLSMEFTQKDQINLLKSKLAKFIDEEPGEGVKTSAKQLHYPQKMITAEILENSSYRITREMDGKNFRLLLPHEKPQLPFASENSVFWIEEDSSTPLIFRMNKGEVEAVYHAKELERTIRETNYELLSVDPEQIDLTSEDHNLHLLSWFQPLKSIQAITKNSGDSRYISEIHLPQLGLSFKKDDKGHARSACGATPGYWIAEKQREPALSSFSRYLLLENAKHEKKVHLIPFDTPALVSLFFLKNIGRISISPLLINTLTNLLEKIENEELSKFLTYTLDREGNLKSSNASTTAYLLLFYLANGEFDKCYNQYSQLELLGRTTSFPKELFPLLDVLVLFLIFSREVQSDELLLKIIALREENILLHQEKKLTSDLSSDSIRWIIAQAVYYKYLKNKSSSLNNFEELFLLKAISRQGKVMTSQLISQIPDEFHVGEWLKRLGVNSLAEHLMMAPKIAKRFHFLRNQHSEGSQWRRRAEALFLCTFFSKKEENSEPVQIDLLPKITESRSSQYTPKTSIITRLFQCAREIKENAPLIIESNDQSKKHFSFNKIQPFIEFVSISELSLSQPVFTASYIKKHFFTLYQLARNELPVGWENDPEKAALFTKKVQLFDRLLSQTLGHFSDPLAQTMFLYLQTAQKRGTYKSLPSPNRLIWLYQQQIIEESLLKDTLALYEEMEGCDETSEEYFNIERKINPLHEELSNLRKKNENFLPSFHLEQELLALRKAGLSNLRTTSFRKVTGFNKLLTLKNAKKVATKASELVANQLLKSLTPDRTLLTWTQRIVNGTLTGGAAVRRIISNIGNEENAARSEYEKMQQAAKVDTHAPLPGELLQVMQQREQGISALLKDFCNASLIGEAPPPSPPPRAEFDPILLDSEESYREAFEKLKQSQDDYYNRPQECDISYTLKPEWKRETFLAAIKDLRDRLNKQLHDEREHMTDYVNQSYTRGSLELAIKQADVKLSSKKRPLAFEELDTCLIQRDDQKLLSLTEMREEHLPDLHRQHFLYHVLASRWHHLNDELAKLPTREEDCTEEVIQKIGQLLTHKRVYSFENMPQHRLLGKLVYESRTHRWIWKIPNKQLDHMLDSPNLRLVNELIMGSGKTAFVIPETNFDSANGENIVINIWPETDPTNAQETGARVGKIFGQKASALKISRQSFPKVEQLSAFYQLLQRTQFSREQINMTKESLQALELNFLENGDQLLQYLLVEKDLSDKFHLYRLILSLLSRKAKCVIDEGHAAFSHEKELNYPFGLPQTLSKEWAKIMAEILFIAMEDEEIAKTLSVKSPKPTSLMKEEYQEKILEPLAHLVATSINWKIAADQQEEFTAYLTGKSREIPAFVKSSINKEKIALAKGIVTTLIPNAIKKVLHVDYDVSQEEDESIVAKPCEGHGNTLERSSIRSPFETFVKSAFLRFHNGLSDKQLKKLILFWQRKAKTYSNQFEITIDQTDEAIQFKELCGIDLFEFTEENQVAIYHQLRKNNFAIKTYLIHFVSKKIRFYCKNASNNPYDFAAIPSSFVSVTGTPHNEGSFPSETEVQNNRGTEGESIDAMIHHASVEIMEAKSPTAFLNELITKFQETPLARAYIDRGADMNGISSYEVAKTLVSYIEGRADIEAVAFYDKGKKKIWKKFTPRPVLFDELPIPEEQRLSYFPQPQTFAADIPQMPKAIAFVSIAKETTFTELAQAFWRMRGVKKTGQKIQFLLTVKVQNEIKPEGGIPTVSEIIAYTKKNELRSTLLDNFSAAKLKMLAVRRRLILNKILFAKDDTTALEILRKHHAIFFRDVQHDPWYLFGLIDTEEDPKKILRKLKAMILNYLDYTFSQEEKSGVENELDEIINNGSFPNKVHCYKAEDNSLIISRSDDLGKEAQISEKANDNVQNEEENENELQQELEQNISLKQQVPKKQTYEQIFLPWPEEIDPTSLDWLEISTPPSSTSISLTAISAEHLYNLTGDFEDYIRKYANEVPIFQIRDVLQEALTEESREIAPLISRSILSTNNISYVVTPNKTSVEPFGPNQVPLLEMLVIIQPEKLPLLLLLDQKEAHYWRKKLKQNRAELEEKNPGVKIGIVDITTKFVVAEGKTPLEKKDLSSPLFIRALTQIKFLRGDVLYNEKEQEILKLWLGKNLDKLMDYFHIVHSHHALNHYGGSPLERIVLQLKKKTFKTLI